MEQDVDWGFGFQNGAVSLFFRGFRSFFSFLGSVTNRNAAHKTTLEYVQIYGSLHKNAM
jgi:hypothetical protein